MNDSDRHFEVDGVRFSFLPSVTTSEFQDSSLQVALCYQRTYGCDPSWNEGKVCHTCSRPKAPKKWNYSGAPSTCPDCGGVLDDFWTIEKIIEDMESELSLPDAVGVLARIDRQVVGACWGFSAEPEELEAHVNHGLAEEAQVTGVATWLRRAFPLAERVGYQDEIFVRQNQQGRKIGKVLFALRLKWFMERGLRVFTLRTKRNPPSISYRWFANGWGYETVAEYPDEDARVVLASSSENILPRCQNLLARLA